MSRLYNVSQIRWLKTKRNFKFSDEIPELPKPIKPNFDDNMDEYFITILKLCECGSDAVGSNKHSDYCPKHQKENQ